MPPRLTVTSGDFFLLSLSATNPILWVSPQRPDGVLAG
jgi:hypothetical protein